MPSLADHPCLRPLDIRLIEHEGRPSLLVQDQLALSGQYMIVPYALGPVLFLCDGRHSVQEIARLVPERYNVKLPEGMLEELLSALDQACFLQNERSATAMDQALQAYRQAPYRPPTLAGHSYPAEPEALASMLDGYLQEVGEVTPWPATGKAVLSPHIDYARGGAVYAQTWKRAAPMAQAADLVIVLATNHYGGNEAVTLTRQHYATPYGVLPTARELVDALAEALGPQVFAGELYHRPEHAIELVLTWLHHMRGRRPVEVLPILTGSFQPWLYKAENPDQDRVYKTFLDTLQTLSRGRRTLIIASGDLAHVGPAFEGDPVDEEGRIALAASDDVLLHALEQGDADGFWNLIKAVEDRNNVCGVSSFYLTLKLVGQTQGQRAAYAICPADEQDTSFVSIAGVGLQ